MHGIGDFPPASDVRIVINAGRAKIATTGQRDWRRFRNDKTALRRALRVIFSHDIARNIPRLFGTHARERSHYHAMGQDHGANPDGREKFGDGSRSVLMDWRIGVFCWSGEGLRNEPGVIFHNHFPAVLRVSVLWV